MPEGINVHAIKVVDCIENYYRKGKAVILNDGEVVGFGKKRRKRNEGKSY